MFVALYTTFGSRRLNFINSQDDLKIESKHRRHRLNTNETTRKEAEVSLDEAELEKGYLQLQLFFFLVSTFSCCTNFCFVREQVNPVRFAVRLIPLEKTVLWNTNYRFNFSNGFRIKLNRGLFFFIDSTSTGMKIHYC